MEPLKELERLYTQYLQAVDNGNLYATSFRKSEYKAVRSFALNTTLLSFKQIEVMEYNLQNKKS